MILFKKKFNTRLILFSILTLLLNSGFSQQLQLRYDNTKLRVQQISVDKYDCLITPSLSIREADPNKMTLSFNLEWYDKNDNQISAPDKIKLFINVNSNIKNYCYAQNKELSTKSITGRNNELPNSFTFLPDGVLSPGLYTNIYFQNGMPHLELNVLNYISTVININLVVYTGKEKSSLIDLEGRTNQLTWSILLPEKKQIPAQQPPQQSNQTSQFVPEPADDLSCIELYDHYNRTFITNKPQFELGYYEGQLNSARSGLLELAQLTLIVSNLNQYKMNVVQLEVLKGEIMRDPNYEDCKSELFTLISSINGSMVDQSRIENYITSFNMVIDDGGGGSGGGGGAGSPYEAFNTNVEFSITTYNKLYDIEMNPEKFDALDPNYFITLYKNLKKKKEMQDSLYAVMVGIGVSSGEKEDYNNFNNYYEGSILIIEDFSPDIAQEVENVEEEEGEAGSKPGKKSKIKIKKPKFPIIWIILPLIAILAAFGIFKYFKFLKKGKSIRDKTK